MIKTVLAGTATKNFTDVIEGCFGGMEDKGLCAAMEAEEGLPPEEEEEAVQPFTSTLSKAMKRKQPSSSETPKKISKKGAPICPLGDASVISPSTKDSKRYLHVGVEDRCISSRHSSSTSQKAGYGCQYSIVMQQEGIQIEDCDFISSVCGQLSTHICQIHLGAAVACYICNKHWWSASTWFDHMERVHPNLGVENYFVQEGSSIEEPRESLIIKQEVTEADL